MFLSFEKTEKTAFENRAIFMRRVVDMSAGGGDMRLYELLFDSHELLDRNSFF